MHPSDEELRGALRRQTPPAGFADRVLGQTREIARRRRRLLVWRWTAAAAAVVTLTVGATIYERQVRQAEGIRAKEEVLLALRVTGVKLRSAQSQVQEIQQRRLEIPAL